MKNTFSKKELNAILASASSQGYESMSGVPFVYLRDQSDHVSLLDCYTYPLLIVAQQRRISEVTALLQRQHDQFLGAALRAALCGAAVFGSLYVVSDISSQDVGTLGVIGIFSGYCAASLSPLWAGESIDSLLREHRIRTDYCEKRGERVVQLKEVSDFVFFGEKAVRRI